MAKGIPFVESGTRKSTGGISANVKNFERIRVGDINVGFKGYAKLRYIVEILGS